VEVQIDLGPVSLTARYQQERPDAPAG